MINYVSPNLNTLLHSSELIMSNFLLYLRYWRILDREWFLGKVCVFYLPESSEQLGRVSHCQMEIVRSKSQGT